MMKPRTSFLTRSLAMALALVLLVSSMNLGGVLQVFAVENGETSVSAGELVANNYELTDEEKALLSSGMLAGETYRYTVPTDSELITVDTENATITADKSGKWNPTTAYIVADGEVVETITLVDGNGSYDPAVGNAFSVKVRYELTQEVDEALQMDLLAAPYWMDRGLQQLADGYNGSDSSLGTVVLALDTLKTLADGFTIDYGAFTVSVQFGADAIAAVKDLRAQVTANEGTLDMQDANAAYNASAYKIEYLLNDGEMYKNILIDTYENLLAIKSDPLTNNAMLDGYLQGADPASYTKWMALKSILGTLVDALEPLATPSWPAADMGTSMINEDTVNYAKLETLVNALENFTEPPAAPKNPLLMAETTIQKNLSMYNVYVEVVLETVVDNEVVVHGTKTATVTLAEGATAEEILSAVDATGVKASALIEWANIYAEEHYETVETELPGEGLYADLDYTVTYSPKNYTVTFSYAEKMVVPYGYKVTLEVHEDPTKAYDYVVNGEPYAQGMTVTIEGDTTITRSSGKAYATTDLYAVVADNYGNEAAQAILKSGALKGNSVINVRKPDPADAESLLTLVDGILTAEGYSAAYNNLNWAPYTYGAEGTENMFSGNQADWSGMSVKVQYILKLTNFSVSEVASVLELAETLKAEAAAQKSTLDAFAANKAAMGQLDKTKLGALNGVISVTDFTPDDGTDTDEANLEMRAYFSALVGGIIANNLDSNNYLKIYNMLGEYETEGLRYYYENYTAFIAEIESLAGYLHGMLEDDAKIAALEIMVNAAGFPEYAEKIADMETKLNNVLESLSEPNEAIDLRSDKLGTLITALTAEGDVVCAEADTAYLLSETLTALDESQVMVQVIIETPKGNATVTSAEMEKGTVLTQAVIDDLKAKVEAKVAEKLGENVKFYTLTVEGTALDDLVGTEITQNVNIYYTYAATEYTVVIDGEADQTVTINNLEVKLPKHPTAGWTYEYTVDGVEGITASTYTFTVEQLGRLFANGSYTITRTEVNDAAEKLEDMVASLNEAVANVGGTVKLVTENGVHTGIDVSIPADGMMDFLMGLTNSGYSYIGLNNEGFLYMNSDNILELSLQTLINAILNDNTFGSETIIALGNNGSGKLVTTSMQLGNAADDIAYEDLDFTLSLSSVPSQMATASSALAKVRNYMTFQSEDGVLQIDLNLPEKVYEAYLAVMLATSNVDKSDTAAVNSAIAFNFLYDYIELVLNSDATTTSFTNTLAKLGQDIDLTGYEGYYEKIKAFLTSDGVKVSGEEDFTVDLDVEGKTAIDKLLALIGMDTTGLETYLGMIAEYKAGNKIAATVVATLGNTDIEFGVAVVDIRNASVANKADFAQVGASVARINALAGEAAVMLLSDLEGDLVFNHTTVLDLNGKTLTGNITANGTLYIIDSSMNTVNCGGVNGNISGNVKIIAGNYTQDVSNYLAKGYVWNNGFVSNALYTIETVKDDAGNITDITFNINSDVYEEVEGYIPSVKALAVDIAADLVLNYFTAATLTVDSETLYAVDVEDVFALLEGNKTENVINELLSWIYVDTGITGFINNVIADLLNFEHIAQAIYNDEAVASYEVTTKPWQVLVSHVAEGDYITVGITNNAELAKTFNLNLVITGNTAKTHVAPLAEELAKIITDETHITVALTQPTYANKTLSAIGGSVDAVVAADLTVNSNYTTVIGVVLAYGNADKADAFVNAINAGDMSALKAAFDNTTVEEVFTALKNLSRNVNFATMASKLGVEIDTADAADLEKVYHLVLCGAGKLLEKLEITGYTDKKMGYLYDAETGYYTLSKLNVNRNGDVSYGGITAEFDATITEVTLKVKIFGEIVEEDCLIGDVNHDNVIDGTDASLILEYVAELEPAVFCFRGADVNGDNVIDGTDASLILEYVAEMRTTFPAESN